MTPLVKFYLDLGMKCRNISQFIQFIGGESLAPFANKVYTMRCEATVEKDESKQTTAKLFGNSGYGKCAEDVERHTETKVVYDGKKLDKYQRSPLCSMDYSICDEDGEEIAHEVKMLKKKIKDNKPVLYGLCILMWSKLLFLRFTLFFVQFTYS